MAIECACERCVKMCKRTPCKPTPAEATALIMAGHAGRLMLVGLEEDDSWAYFIPGMLVPASKGNEGKTSGYYDDLFGECTFLTEAGLCELHAAGLKPMEGRLGACEKWRTHDEWEDPDELRDRVCETWGTWGFPGDEKTPTGNARGVIAFWVALMGSETQP